jgi:hypothetical protein
MPQVTCGVTTFDFEPGLTGKVKIITPEGSTVAVAGEDLAKFIYATFVLPERQARAERQEWREGLLG